MASAQEQARLALDAIGQIPDNELDLAGAALQFARIDQPDADWLSASATLSVLARDAVALGRDRVDGDAAVRAGALAGLLAGRWRFKGDRTTFDDPVNANLIQVLQRRRGLPVALGILWLHCARAAGWDAFGIDFPGHFLVGLPSDGGPLVLDVFGGGGSLDVDELRALIKQVEGPRAALRPGVLQPLSARGVLLRLQNNIKLRRINGGDVAGGLTAVLDMLRIAPDHAPLWREAALLHQRLDQVGASLHCYEQLLRLMGTGEAAERVRTAMDDLRNRLN